MSTMQDLERLFAAQVLSMPGYVLADLERLVDAARREGAEAMQQRMFPCCGGNDESPAEHNMDCCARPLPTGKRQTVRLTDEQIERGREQVFSTGNPFCPCDAKTMRKATRWAESAVLAANGLGDAK